MADQPKKGEKFLKKAEREACWKAKDNFWDCLTSNQEDASKCGSYRKEYETLCPQSWVVHFDRKFQYEKFKKKIMSDGQKAVDEEFMAAGQKKGS